MKALFLDPFSGISGDMVLGLLVDLGVPVATLEQELRRLPVRGWRIEAGRDQRRGLAGCRVRVHCPTENRHRTWADIDRMLAESSLQPAVTDLARRIFRRLGEAESRVHGVPLEEVHFHEVGALDSIIDVVGAAVGLNRLGAGRIVCGPLPLGHGMIDSSHGRYPLPAPATAELLRGAPVTTGQSGQELVTPTGAAIVAEVAHFGPLPAMTLDAVGYGVGSRDLPDRPNLLRGMFGRCGGDQDCDEVAILETHLDDSPAEWLGTLLDRLLEAGALDAGFTPCQMKKNRPGVRLTVVAPLEKEAPLARLVLRESSASGIRMRRERRLKLRRELRQVQTRLGPATVKLLFEGEALLRATPEHSDCRALATASGCPLPEVYRQVERAADDLFGPATEQEA